MTRALVIRRGHGGLSLQDMGRPGYLSQGLSRGGAADRLALAEGAALLRQDGALAAIEMAGMGGEFEATEDTRIALTGAPMAAEIEGEALTWNASHLLPAGARLRIEAARRGNYGYLHLGGGADGPCLLGARSAHLAAGLGAALESDARLPLGEDPHPEELGQRIDPLPRLDGGEVRFVAGPQTGLFGAAELERFCTTAFHRDLRGNRMGIRFVPDGEGFHAASGLSVLSEVIVPGDIQMTGDGTPFVLLSECQTTGGYPRIGSVLPCDLPRVAQTRPGEVLRFRQVPLDEAVALEQAETTRRAGLRRELRPLIRDARDIRDLLAYQLISGVTAGDDLEREEP